MGSPVSSLTLQTHVADTDLFAAETGAGAGVKIPGTAFVRANADGLIAGMRLGYYAATVTGSIGGATCALYGVTLGTPMSGFADLVSVVQGYSATVLAAGNSGVVVAEPLVLRPWTDNAVDLGGASYRWANVRAANGSIITSDAHEKEQVGTIPDQWLDAWGDVEWVRYRFIAAVAEKGDDARWHVGMVAQGVRDAFAARDLDATAIGLLCHDVWEAVTEPVRAEVEKTRKAQKLVLTPANIEGHPDAVIPELVEVDETYTEWEETGETREISPAGERWGLRYDECQAMEAAWQRREIARMAARLAALEGDLAPEPVGGED